MEGNEFQVMGSSCKMNFRMNDKYELKGGNGEGNCGGIGPFCRPSRV
jgi:hypothetical protein